MILNVKFSFWFDFNAGARKKSVRYLLLFWHALMIYSKDYLQNPNYFWLTSLFSTIFYIYMSELISDLASVNNWVFQMKISFNSDPNKETQKIKFGRKKQNSSYLH